MVFHARKRSQVSFLFSDNCHELINQVSDLVARAIDGPFTFEQLRTLDALRQLVTDLTRCKAESLIFSLLWCALDFKTKANDDETSVETSRSFACEIAAMRLLRRYDAQEVLSSLTTEYSAVEQSDVLEDIIAEDSSTAHAATQRTPLLRVDTRESTLNRASDLERVDSTRSQRSDTPSLTALEVAIVAEAKHFTSSQIVQDILTEIWYGEVVFWSRISQNEMKRARYYNKTKDARFWNFARLRVPCYAFILESFNFVILSGLYLLVVADREFSNLGWIEAILALWFVGFAYQEWDQMRAAGQFKLYCANIFNYFDIGMIVIAFAWMILRAIGIYQHDKAIVGTSYDVLSLQGVLLVPRLFSFLSLTPYFGTLFPCLRRLTVDFVKFLVLIVAMFLGFLVTFSILGRNHYSLYEITWLLIRIFFGGSGIGFDAMHNLSAEFGEPLMLTFVTFTQILLTTVLISILSNSFSRVMDNARAEYLFLFATTCLEASKSDHAVLLLPPFNLLNLLVVRPLRLVLPSHHWLLQELKIGILKVTHAPFLLFISLYERSYLAPTMSEAHRRRLEKSKGLLPGNRTLTQTLGTPTGSKIAPLLFAPKAKSFLDDTDDEEGLDTGVMIESNTGDKELKLRLELMEKQMSEMKAMLETVLKK